MYAQVDFHQSVAYFVTRVGMKGKLRKADCIAALKVINMRRRKETSYDDTKFAVKTNTVECAKK